MCRAVAGLVLSSSTTPDPCGVRSSSGAATCSTCSRGPGRAVRFRYLRCRKRPGGYGSRRGRTRVRPATHRYSPAADPTTAKPGSANARLPTSSECTKPPCRGGCVFSCSHQKYWMRSSAARSSPQRLPSWPASCPTAPHGRGRRTPIGIKNQTSAAPTSGPRTSSWCRAQRPSEQPNVCSRNAEPASAPPPRASRSLTRENHSGRLISSTRSSHRQRSTERVGLVRLWRRTMMGRGP